MFCGGEGGNHCPRFEKLRKKQVNFKFGATFNKLPYSTDRCLCFQKPQSNTSC